MNPFRKLRYNRKITAVSMLAENMTAALWRALVWTLFFCGLWLFGLPALLGQTISALTAIIFLTGFGYFLYQDTRHFSIPRARDIDRRIEKDNRLKHRPVSSLEDRLSNPEKSQTQALWAKNRDKSSARLSRLRAGRPAPFLAKLDPNALRLGVLMFFILGLIVAGPAGKDRIWNGLTPLSWSANTKNKNAETVWITPPPYTHQKQIALSESHKRGDALEIPEGSSLKVRVNGGLGRPSIFLDGQKQQMRRSSKDSYGFEIDNLAAQKLKIRQLFKTRGAWHLKIRPDEPPGISLSGEVQILPDASVRIPLSIKDDYGVRTIRLDMDLPGGSDYPPLGAPYREERAASSPPGEEIKIAPVYDLGWHAWAGRLVNLVITSEDGAGHSASTETIRIDLPQRHFTRPAAQSVSALRTSLFKSPLSNYMQYGRALEFILSYPDQYSYDFKNFLFLRSAASRFLYADPSLDTAEELAGLLWDIALRLEDGNLSLAARKLRDVQNALEKALNDPETRAEDMATLMEELRAALGEYFSELQKKLQSDMAAMENPPSIPPDMLTQMINPDMLNGFLEELQAEIMAGNIERVRELLSQLQNMTDTLNPSASMQMPEDMQMMSEAVQALDNLIRRQETLLKGTREQADMLKRLKDISREYLNQSTDNWAQDNPLPENLMPAEPYQPVISGQDQKGEQEAIRLLLGDLMRRMGEKLPAIPENLEKAEQEMRGSSQALGDNQPALSVPHQEFALEYLKDTQEQMTEQLSARMKNMTGLMFSRGMRFDPLGRPYGDDGQMPGFFPGSRIKIPDESEQKKAEEILEILRERSGDLNRPDEELDYYRRLLRRF